MPIAKVQLPDGRIGRFEVPEGTTPEQVMEFAGTIPETKQEVSKTESFARGVGQGATFGTSDEIGGGIRSLARGVARGIEEKIYGDNMLQPVSYEQARDAERNANETAQQANPKTYLAGELTGAVTTGVAGANTKIGAAVGNSVRTGLLPQATSALGKAANFGTKVVQSSALGAASSGAYGAGTAKEGERLQEAKQAAGYGALVGAALPVAGAAVNSVKNAVVPVIDDAIKPLAQRARDFGIPLRADQVAPTRARNTVQKISQELPFSGADKFEATQKAAFTRAVASTLGQDTDNLGAETIKKFRKDVGKQFDNVLSGKEVAVGAQDIQALEAIKVAARKNIETGLADVVDRNVDDVLKDFAGGTLQGNKLASIRSELVKSSTRAQGGAAEFIGDIVEQIDNIAKNNVSEKEGLALDQARKRWRNFRTIQPLLEKSTDGTIEPTQLINRVASSRFIDASNKEIGDDALVDLARIGKEFLVKKGGSDTFQKAALGSGVVAGIGGIAANPLLTLQTAAATGGTLLANRGLQAVNSSQKLIDAALKARGSAKMITNKVPVHSLIAAGQGN
jgi:hypothetical protein